MDDAMKRDPFVGRYAGIISRAVAFGIDLVAISLTVLVVAALALALEGFFPGRIFAGLRSAVTLGAEVFGAAFFIAYPITFWTLFGQTPGDMLMGLRIVRTDGQQMTLRRALLRYLGCLLASLPLFLGFFWILVDDRRQGWQDKLAGTCVLYVEQRVLRQDAADRPPLVRAHG
jgi:uncharacterized RDD family membrane protein YckC